MSSHSGQLVARAQQPLGAVEPRQQQRSGGMAGFGGDVVRSWFRSGSASDCSAPRTPVTELQRARKRRRAFALPRMKFLGEADVGQRVPVNNNSIGTCTSTSTTPLTVHFKEVKHICSKCRGAEPPDGESWEPGSGGIMLGGRRCCCCCCCLSEGDPVRSMTSAGHTGGILVVRSLPPLLW